MHLNTNYQNNVDIKWNYNFEHIHPHWYVGYYGSMAPWPCLIFTIWSMDPWIHSMRVVYSIWGMPTFVPSGGCGFYLSKILLLLFFFGNFFFLLDIFHIFVFVFIVVLLGLSTWVCGIVSRWWLWLQSWDQTYFPKSNNCLSLTAILQHSNGHAKLFLVAWGLHRRGIKDCTTSASLLAPKELYTWYCPMTIQQRSAPTFWTHTGP